MRGLVIAQPHHASLHSLYSNCSTPRRLHTTPSGGQLLHLALEKSGKSSAFGSDDQPNPSPLAVPNCLAGVISQKGLTLKTVPFTGIRAAFCPSSPSFRVHDKLKFPAHRSVLLGFPGLTRVPSPHSWEGTNFLSGVGSAWRETTSKDDSYHHNFVAIISFSLFQTKSPPASKNFKILCKWLFESHSS